MDPYPSRYAETSHTLWQLVKSYWQSQQRFPAYLFFTIVMIMTVSLVGLNIAYNYWYNYFYDVLQSYDQRGAVRILIVLFSLGAFYLILAIYRFYIAQLFGLHWRRWVTQQFTGYLCQANAVCQRTQDEINSLVNFSINLSMGLIGIITTFLMFLYYLWLLSDDLASIISKWSTMPVSGYMVCVGVIYALMGIFFTLKFGRPLLSLHGNPSRAHARSAQPHMKLLLWFKTGYNHMLIVLPLLMVFPNYFETLFLVGWFLQSLQAFNRVQNSFPSIVNSCPVSEILLSSHTK